MWTWLADKDGNKFEGKQDKKRNEIQEQKLLPKLTHLLVFKLNLKTTIKRLRNKKPNGFWMQWRYTWTFIYIKFIKQPKLYYYAVFFCNVTMPLNY